jgi:hypothetical protein
MARLSRLAARPGTGKEQDADAPAGQDPGRRGCVSLTTTSLTVMETSGNAPSRVRRPVE